MEGRVWLDDRVTAPLSGFSSGRDNYARTSAMHHLSEIRVPTLILAAQNDPIVPASCFSDHVGRLPEHVQVLMTRCGGHVGFLGRGTNRFWMDGVLQRWCAALSPCR